jgi:hypothetical protein
LKALLADWKLALAMAGAAVAAVAMIAYAFFRPAEDQEGAERKRRLHLNQIGRMLVLCRTCGRGTWFLTATQFPV